MVGQPIAEIKKQVAAMLSKNEIFQLKASLDSFQPTIKLNPDKSMAKKVFSSCDLSADYNFLKLATDESIIRCVADYLGAPPIIEFLTAWEVFPDAGATNEMYFHMDHQRFFTLASF